MRPAVIVAANQDVHLVIGLGTLLGGIERAVRGKVDALHVAVAIGEDVAAHALDLRVILGDRAIEVEPERLALVGGVVGHRDLVGRRQALRLDGDAPVAELAFAAIADGIVELAVGRADLEAARIVIVLTRQAGDQLERFAQRAIRLVVGEPDDFHEQIGVGAVGIGHPRVLLPRLVDVAVGCIDVVVAGALQQAGIEGEAEQAVLAARRRHFLDVDGHLLGAVGGVDAGDPAAGALGQPKPAVRAPADLPRSLEAIGQHRHLELLGARDGRIRRVLRQGRQG